MNIVPSDVDDVDYELTENNKANKKESEEENREKNKEDCKKINKEDSKKESKYDEWESEMVPMTFTEIIEEAEESDCESELEDQGKFNYKQICFVLISIAFLI
jgi:hypothetical protein